MQQPDEWSRERDDLLILDAAWAGWRIGQVGSPADVPPGGLPLRARMRARTYLRRLPHGLTSRIRVRLALAFGDGYLDGAIEVTWQWARRRGDLMLADDMRALSLDGAW